MYGNYALLCEDCDSGSQRLLLRPNGEDSAFYGYGKIIKAELYIRKFGEDSQILTASRIQKSWCAFNTGWSTLPEYSGENTVLKSRGDYVYTDISDVLRSLAGNLGLILINKEKGEQCAVATADSYNYPMIIKIQYE